MMTALVLSLALAASPSPSYGVLDFPVTGNSECRRLFVTGMLQLHSFQYDDAHETFQAAAKADPRCAMAHWGDAMAYSHPIWGEEEPKLAQAALARVQNERELRPTERAHLAAARALYGSGDIGARHQAWLQETGRALRAFPADDELALQHALALMATSERFRNTGRLMQAAAIAMDVFQRKPNHPGAAHYFIHACDTPDHAVLALPAARKYARIAPASSHARHMPSHIFVQLGMWSDSAASNEDAWAASEQWATRRKLGQADRDYHTYSWLGASYLELGQVSRARAVLDDIARRMKQDDRADIRFNYSALARKYLADTGRWSEARGLYAPIEKPLLEKGEAEESLGCALHSPAGGSDQVRVPVGLFARSNMQGALADGAMRAGDEAGVKVQLAALDQTRKAMEPWATMLPADVLERQALRDAAYLAGARAYRERTSEAWSAAVEAMARYADTGERGDHRPPSGPAFEAPARLLVADLLLEANRPKEALAAYDATLLRYANLSRALLGSARAAQRSGDVATARDRYATLATQWKHADPGLPELEEVRTGAKAQRTSRR